MTLDSAGRSRVKICGITNARDRAVAVAAGADAVGFITGVPVDTPREVTPETACELAGGLPPFVTGVLVTMPESVSQAVSIHQTVGADALQIHGSLAPTAIEAVRDSIDVPVLAAVDAGQAGIDAYAGATDALLVDSTDGDGAGGTGETHDWEQTRRHVEDLDTPVVLAGGLTPGNVRDAIDTAHPFGVDVASGVETSGGKKDHTAVREFVSAAGRTEVITRE